MTGVVTETPDLGLYLSPDYVLRVIGVSKAAMHDLCEKRNVRTHKSCVLG